jgi:hypothetical protein
MRHVALLTLLAAVACAKAEAPAPPAAAAKAALAPPSAEQAKSLIADSPELGDHQFTDASYTLPVKTAAMNEPAKLAAKDLAAAGWLHITGDAVVLAEKSKSDKRILVRPNGVIDFVPLAKKELVSIDGVHANGHDVAVSLTWTWLPNDLGKSFHHPPVANRFAAPKHATATLIPEGDHWTVGRVKGEE